MHLAKGWNLKIHRSEDSCILPKAGTCRLVSHFSDICAQAQADNNGRLYATTHRIMSRLRMQSLVLTFDANLLMLPIGADMLC